MRTNQKGFAEFVVILIIAVVALSLIGFNLYKGGKVLTTPTDTPQLNEFTAIDTTNWEIYESDEFSYNYPKNLYHLNDPRNLASGNKDIQYYLLSEEVAKDYKNCLARGELQLKEFEQNPDKDIVGVDWEGACDLGRVALIITVNSYGANRYKTLKAKESLGDGTISGLTDFQDSLGRQWTINKPDLGMADRSGADAEILINNKYFLIHSTMHPQGMESYLGTKLITQNKNSYDASLALNIHDQLLKQILSTFRFFDDSEATTSLPAVTPPQNWKAHGFRELTIKIYIPNEWESGDIYDSATQTTSILMFKDEHIPIPPARIDIKKSWDNTGNAQNLIRNYTIGDNINAAWVDPPKKGGALLERYQTKVYFEHEGEVYVFTCNHDWEEDILDTCNNILKYLTFYENR